MARARPLFVILSCEHGGNRVPPRYAGLFARAAAELQSHRAYDRGALAVARALARRLRAPLHSATVTRLLVDLNRSPHHPRVLSDFSRTLPPPARAALMARHYHPHRDAVEAAIAAAIGSGARVLHVAIHSFTPVLDGQARGADIGLLYDPAHRFERELCRRWASALGAAQEGALRVRRNYPYRGASDGLATWLRRRLPARQYAGIELEINQRLLLTAADTARVARIVDSALRVAMNCSRDAAVRRISGGA
ncbi:MAG: N-formylglutamate amidohydrolase [Gammaproteobacteria bacterium]